MNPTTPKLPPQGHLDSRASKLARVFSHDSGVRVEVVPGVVPRYNQTTKQIEIPSEIDDMGVGLQKVVEGFLEHEVCHARTWKRMEEERAAGKPMPDFLRMVSPSSPRKTVLNALLDAHDELANPNAGSRDMIRDVHEWGKRYVAPPKSKASPLLKAACDMFTRVVGSGPLGVRYEKPATEKAIAECAEIVREELSKGWNPRAVANLLDPISRRLAAALEEEEKSEAKPQQGDVR